MNLNYFKYLINKCLIGFVFTFILIAGCKEKEPKIFKFTVSY
jgi:hypothetical protein